MNADGEFEDEEGQLDLADVDPGNHTVIVISSILSLLNIKCVLQGFILFFHIFYIFKLIFSF